MLPLKITANEWITGYQTFQLVIISNKSDFSHQVVTGWMCAWAESSQSHQGEYSFSPFNNVLSKNKQLCLTEVCFSFSFVQLILSTIYHYHYLPFLTQIEFFFFVFADIHTEAVQAALAKHKEEKMALPMPTKRRSTYVQSPVATRTPPGRTGRRTVLQIGL